MAAAGAETTRGRCLCGAVRFAYAGPPKWVAHCHCESCRRATSSPFTTFVGVATTAFAQSGQPARVYVSSAGVRRSFCGDCGSPVAYESSRWPGEIHLYAASLEHPENLHPQAHVHAAERLPWIHLADGLPCLPGSGG